MKYDIKHRISGKALFSLECDSLKLCVKAAIKKKADLRGADLRDACLEDAYLRGADLRGTYLEDAYLGGANLRGADLRGAYLRGTYLGGADLRDAYLEDAYLRGTYLGGANLRGTYLIDGGQRSDGYRFIGQVKNGALWIHSGCRYFTIAGAREHWRKTREGTPLGDETMARLD